MQMITFTQQGSSLPCRKQDYSRQGNKFPCCRSVWTLLSLSSSRLTSIICTTPSHAFGVSHPSRGEFLPTTATLPLHTPKSSFSWQSLSKRTLQITFISTSSMNVKLNERGSSSLSPVEARLLSLSKPMLQITFISTSSMNVAVVH